MQMKADFGENSGASGIWEMQRLATTPMET